MKSIEMYPDQDDLKRAIHNHLSIPFEHKMYRGLFAALERSLWGELRPDIYQGLKGI